MPTIADLLCQTRLDRRESELLLGFVLKKDRTFVLAHKTDAIDTRSAKRFMALIKRRRKHEPIAYLTGSQPFFGRDFLVNKHTLIPRPETEILVDLVKRHLSRDEVLGTRYLVVDVGTGSGCLAVTLALEYPLASVIASDTSDDALKVARKNARRLGAKVKFVKESLLGPKLLRLTTPSRLRVEPPLLQVRRGSVAESLCRSEVPSCCRRGNEGVVFVANLPYLPLSDKKTMMPDVAKYEPSKALFAGHDGSSLIVKLLKQIRTWNLEFGIMNLDHKPYDIPYSKFHIPYSIFLEIDPRQTKKLTAVAHQLFPKHTVNVKLDLCGRERFLLIFPSSSRVARH
jgi:release factor glutamine methyltransferase